MKNKLPLVTVVTVNYNGKHLIKDCFDSLSALNYPKDKLELIMVDNGSRDDSVKYTKSYYPDIKIIKNDVNNYCRANNLAIAQSEGKYVALLNNDTKVDKDWLAELVDVMRMGSKVGAVGSKILFMDGRIQSVGHMECPNYYRTDKGFLEEDRGQYNKLQEVESVSNCSVLYHREALNSIGLFDEDFVMYMEDVDAAFRLKKRGWSIWYAPKSVTYHTLHGSRQDSNERQFYVERNRLLFLAKYFPDKLPEYLCGFGNVVKFKYPDFIKILISIFDKLVESKDFKNNITLLARLQKSIETIYDYRQLSFREEVENLSDSLRQELLAKETQLNSFQEILKTQGEESRHRLTEVKVRDEQLKNQQEVIQRLEKDAQAKETNLSNLSEEIKSKDDIIDSKEGKLKSQQEVIETLQKEIQNKAEGVNSLTEELNNQKAQLKAQQEAVRAKDKQIESFLAELRSQNEQIKACQEAIRVKEESVGSQGALIASKDEQLKNQQEEILRSEETLRNKEAQLKSLHEILKTQDEESHRRLTELQVKDEKLKSNQLEILRLKEDSRAKETNLSNLSEEIKNKDRVIEAKEEYIQKQNSTISSKEEKAQILYKELLSKEKQLNFLQNHLMANEEKISFKIAELNIKDKRLNEQENIIMMLRKEIENEKEENIRQYKKLEDRNNQLNALESRIRLQEQSIAIQIDELKDKDRQLAEKDAIIAKKNEEILKIYNSESYRLVVKPIIWPLLSLIKKITHPPQRLLHSLINTIRKEDSGICIAQLFAKGAIAKYMQENEYSVRIVSNNFQREKIKLVLDIWPWRDQKHPQRHYVYFATEVIIDPKKPCLIKAVYNWERGVKFWIDNIEAPLCDFWRGEMKSFEVFMIFANIHDAENKAISSLSILQRLEK